VDQSNGWVAGENGLIYHTTDSGKTWQKQECTEIIPMVDKTQWETPTPSLYSIWFSDALHGWASGMDATIIATEDGGTTWKKIKNPAEASKLTLYKIVAREGKLWTAGQKGAYLRSVDNGQTWEMQANAIGTKFWLRDMDFCDSLNGWAVGSRGTIARTEDGGKTWTMLSGIPVK